MLNCFITSSPNTTSISLIPLLTTSFEEWLNEQPSRIKNWLSQIQFQAKPGSFALLPTEDGHLEQVLLGVDSYEDKWMLSSLPSQLPQGVYCLNTTNLSLAATQLAVIGWGLGSYTFQRYKKHNKSNAQLILPENCSKDEIESKITSVYLVRDLINTPAEDMGPAHLAQVACDLAKEYNVVMNQTVGDALLTQHYPAIYAVGRASHVLPRLIDFVWGEPSAAKLTLVGKGVCFDSGGLDLKAAKDMALMKKDMGGAAHVLGLAKLIMNANLPVRLRVLIPAVENVIAGNAYRPGDVIDTRKGLTVEIGNTDAEGRVVLADALCAACEEDPDLVIDLATLTGAARIALGPDVPVFFTNTENFIPELLACSKKVNEAVWPLPLYKPYKKYLDSPIADLNNAADNPYGGAITAALFLQEFVEPKTPWIHFDLMAWNLKSQPGRPQGGEAMGLNTLFEFLQQRYGD